jgi:hypothetical protein
MRINFLWAQEIQIELEFVEQVRSGILAWHPRLEKALFTVVVIWCFRSFQRDLQQSKWNPSHRAFP